MSQAFDFENLVELCRRIHEETRHSAGRAVDRSLVARNWLFGRYIVEYEQNGADRGEIRQPTLGQDRQPPAKNRDKGQFGDPPEALPAFLPTAEENRAYIVGPIGILGVF